MLIPNWINKKINLGGTVRRKGGEQKEPSEVEEGKGQTSAYLREVRAA